MADAKVTALTPEVSVPALEDLTYWVDDPSGTPVGTKASMTRALGLVGQLPGGRLTLTTATPVTTAEVTTSSTIYYTPYLHDRIRIYDGTRWRVYVFAELSLALSALTSGKNYDVFVYDNAGTLTLELSAAWTTDIARADALTTQDGVYVKSGATTRLYLGTIRTISTSATCDYAGGTTTNVGGQRYVWNAYNRVLRSMSVIDTTDSWSYATDTIRQARATAGNKVEYVVGLQWEIIKANIICIYLGASNTSKGAKAGVGIDSTTTYTGLIGAGLAAGSSTYIPLVARYTGFPGIGYHYLSWNEKGCTGGTTLFCGDNGADAFQSGMTAEVWA